MLNGGSRLFLVYLSLLFQKDTVMRTYDFSPLYRSAIGFDRLAQLFDNAQRADSQPSYPPYNIELVADDKYRITMAVAGFSNAEIDIEAENDTLKIVGRKQKEEGSPTFLHRGIAARDFEQRFQLANHIKVVGAQMENGLLSIELVREVPEALKPRKIEINADNVHRLERTAA
jgi:molecular chaperone IbpA